MGCISLPCLSVIGLSVSYKGCYVCHFVRVYRSSLLKLSLFYKCYKGGTNANYCWGYAYYREVAGYYQEREVEQPFSILSHKHLHMYNVEQVTCLSPSLDPSMSSSAPRSYLSSIQSTNIEIGIQNILRDECVLCVLCKIRCRICVNQI